MRKIFLLMLIPLLSLSCSKEEGTEDVTLELLPVSQVELPNSFSTDKENIIKVKYIRPTECYTFNKFYFESTGTSSTIAIETKVARGNSCLPIQANGSVTQNFKFNPEIPGEYTLKFWQGKDENNTDLFLTYDIIVE